MSLANKMLIVAGLARTVYSRWRLQRLLFEIMAVAALAIIVMMLTGMIIIGGFYAMYITFLDYGWQPQFALLYTGVFALLTIAALIALMGLYVRRMRSLPHKLLGKSETLDHIGLAIDAFLEGLMSEDPIV